jgi:hypothetical protein
VARLRRRPSTTPGGSELAAGRVFVMAGRDRVASGKLRASKMVFAARVGRVSLAVVSSVGAGVEPPERLLYASLRVG